MADTLKVEIAIPRDGIEGALYGAFSSGGIGYWASVDVSRSAWSGARDIDLAPMVEGGEIAIVDREDDDKQYTLDHAALLRGLALLAEIAPIHFGAIMSNAYDKITGDALVQCALFGELRYS